MNIDFFSYYLYLNKTACNSTYFYFKMLHNMLVTNISDSFIHERTSNKILMRFIKTKNTVLVAVRGFIASADAYKYQKRGGTENL